MFKKLFLGTTEVDFKTLGSRFYKIFIIEAVIFISILIAALTGILNMNLSVDFTGGTTYQLDTSYTDDDISDVLGNSILEVSRYQTFENSNTIIFRAVESTQENETHFLNYLGNKFDVITNDIELLLFNEEWYRERHYTSVPSTVDAVCQVAQGSHKGTLPTLHYYRVRILFLILMMVIIIIVYNNSNNHNDNK